MKLNIRFKYWMLTTSTVLVLLLTGLFLKTAFEKFATVAEENAKVRFSLLTQRASTEIINLVSNMSHSVATLSSSTIGAFVQGGKINQNDLVSTFMGALANNPNIYGMYFGLNNDEFVQVIGVRSEQKIIDSLKAPAQSHFAIRRLTQGENPTEHWQFFNREGIQLQERSDVAGYTPSGRPWFMGALKRNELFITEPYVFSSTGELGLTISAPLPGKTGALGADINLGTLNKFLASLPLTPNAAILMLDERNRILAFHGHGNNFEGLNLTPLTAIDVVKHPVLHSLIDLEISNEPKILALGTDHSEDFFVVSSHLSQAVASTRFRVISMAPMLDFIAPVEQARSDVLLVSGTILLLLLPLSLLASRQVVNSLAQLARNSEHIKHLDFAFTPIPSTSPIYEINTLSDAQLVMHQSIREKTNELKLSQDKLARLVENGLLLAKEQDRGKLLHHILLGSRDIANCAACTLFLKTEHNTLSFAMRTGDDKLPPFEVPLYHPETGEPMTGFVSSYVALKNETILIDDVYSETRFDLSGTMRFSEQTGFRVISMLTVPLSPHAGEVIGVLQLMNALDHDTGKVISFPHELITYIEALASQSAVALENQNLVNAQKELMDSMIRIIAGAIDAKSAYTGGHCERVPELAIMLAKEAANQTTGALAGFSFKNDDEWREFRIGAWLHDCGKVTTPEYVVDKATKLETIYNRIHEVRSRFEIVLRDAMIDRLEAIAAGVPESDADATFTERKQQLIDDFTFVAVCNLGGEFMADERVERLKKIGSQTWLRHFDNRLGLSHEELRRYENAPATALPTTENLLADQPWHIIPRTETRVFDPKYGFQMKVPEHLYNFGELYNLAITRGTLSDEERFKINEHIIQTIVMLDNMPFPKHLKRVPEYAGTHHETLIGTGYPRKLSQEQLSVPSRIMAIADIFEALTASDRPYKNAKTLSESIKILSLFKKDQHIDAELFDLFLTSGVYRRYAERFLKPEQIDEVDVAQFVP